MDPSHLKELVTLEDNYWWHVAKRQLVISLLEKILSSAQGDWLKAELDPVAIWSNSIS
ncbi:MAG: hypothetical protein U0936_20400 [Planctomycetaceae bacterium]